MKRNGEIIEIWKWKWWGGSDGSPAKWRNEATRAENNEEREIIMISINIKMKKWNINENEENGTIIILK